MSVSEWTNYAASIFTTLGGIFFMVSYTITARWWETTIGRMLMVCAGSVTGLALISVIFYLLKIDVTWIRFIRAGLIFLTGTVMIYQGSLVIRVQLRNLRGRRT